ncbi:uncharacterized protein LOC115777924 isoform X2 [Archocentrus centrarchus]|uniref:uncharacterized protein LOC115777924 isoform X2 n=1 Tax=Archocentrus centrarchus TaxID=63155 RepID=UPI0011EA0E6C|nr:uncharacterized protein LOC115777924 isoform X2 [Archocentrus centrarchus]
MAAVTWIQMSSFLLLMLQVKAATTGNTLPSFTVRAGHDTSLSCENVIDGQQNCSSTTWMFSGSTRGAAVELVVHGQITENTEAKSDRLSVAVNCSLVIKKVTDDDVGRYTCRQFRTRGGKQEGGDTVIDLSVIHMTERENNDEVILSCSVWTHEPCRHSVQWLFEGKENMKVKAGSCSDTVTFTRSQLNQKSQFYESLKCKVTHDYTNNEQLFPFKLKSSGEDAKTTTTTTTFKPTSEEVKSSGFLLRWIFVFVGLAALIISAVKVNMWTKTKGIKTQTEGNTVHKDEDEGSVIYENSGEPSASVRLH